MSPTLTKHFLGTKEGWVPIGKPKFRALASKDLVHDFLEHPFRIIGTPEQDEYQAFGAIFYMLQGHPAFGGIKKILKRIAPNLPTGACPYYYLTPDLDLPIPPEAASWVYFGYHRAQNRFKKIPQPALKNLYRKIWSQTASLTPTPGQILRLTINWSDLSFESNYDFPKK